MSGIGDRFDSDTFRQQCTELEAEAELRQRDYDCGRIDWETYQFEHFCLVAKYRALRRYLIASHDEEERQNVR